MSLRVSLPVYVRISLCVPPYVSLCVPLRVSLPSNLFIYPSMCLSVCPSPCVIICVPLRVSVRTGAAGVVFRPNVSIGLMQFGSGGQAYRGSSCRWTFSTSSIYLFYRSRSSVWFGSKRMLELQPRVGLFHLIHLLVLLSG